MAKRPIEAEVSSANIFEDIGFDKAEVVEAAVILGVNQLKVLVFSKGNSLGRLIRFVNGLDVEL